MRGKDDEVVLKEKTKRLVRIMPFWMVPSPGLRLDPSLRRLCWLSLSIA